MSVTPAVPENPLTSRYVFDPFSMSGLKSATFRVVAAAGPG